MGLSTVANGGNEGSKTAGGGFFHEELEGEGEGERRSIGVRRRGFCKAGWFEGCLKKAPAGNWNHLVGHRDVGVLDFQWCSRNLQCKMKSVLRGSEHSPEGTSVGKELGRQCGRGGGPCCVHAILHYSGRV